MILVTYYGPVGAVNLGIKFSKDVLSVLIDRSVVSGQHPRLLGKLAELNWMLLRGQWKKSQPLADAVDADLVEGMGQLLAVVAEQNLPSFPVRFQAAVVCSAISIVRSLKNSQGQPTADLIRLLDKWVRPAAHCAQACLLQMGVSLQADDQPATGSGSTSFVTALCLALLRELILLISKEDASSNSSSSSSSISNNSNCNWMAALQENFLLQCVISGIQMCIHLRRGWDVVEAAFAVLHAVAATSAGSNVLTSLQLEQFLWLPLEAICEFHASLYLFRIDYFVLIVC